MAISPQIADAFLLQFSIDVRVVDQLVREKDAFSLEALTSFKDHIDGLVDAVAKTKMFRKMKHEISKIPHPSRLPDLGDGIGLIILMVMLKPPPEFAEFLDDAFFSA